MSCFFDPHLSKKQKYGLSKQQDISEWVSKPTRLFLSKTYFCPVHSRLWTGQNIVDYELDKNIETTRHCQKNKNICLGRINGSA